MLEIQNFKIEELWLALTYEVEPEVDEALEDEAVSVDWPASVTKKHI